MNSSHTQLSQVDKRQNTIHEQDSALLFRSTICFRRKRFSPSIKKFHFPEFQQSPKKSKAPFSLYKEAQVPFFSRFKILVLSIRSQIPPFSLQPNKDECNSPYVKKPFIQHVSYNEPHLVHIKDPLALAMEVLPQEWHYLPKRPKKNIKFYKGVLDSSGDC